MARLRRFMFERVYLAGPASHEQRRVTGVIGALFDHYMSNLDLLPAEEPGGKDDAATRVTDYLAGMTDRFCIREFKRLAVPREFQ
jgi:dGTPase